MNGRFIVSNSDVAGDWNMTFLFSHILRYIIIPIDELIFFRGLKPPTRFPWHEDLSKKWRLIQQQKLGWDLRFRWGIYMLWDLYWILYGMYMGYVFPKPLMHQQTARSC